MDELIGQGKIANGIIILSAVEVIPVVGECLTQTMTIIQHRRHTVEAEAVEVELLQPVFAVREEEMDYLILTVVEAQTVPGGMLMHASCVEELIRIAGQVS